jgi:hypothetical protein
MVYLGTFLCALSLGCFVFGIRIADASYSLVVVELPMSGRNHLVVLSLGLVIVIAGVVGNSIRRGIIE